MVYDVVERMKAGLPVLHAGHLRVQDGVLPIPPICRVEE